jgi:hypothetical protein
MRCRDSAGRTREELNFSIAGPDGRPAPTAAVIIDPAAKMYYYLDLLKHVASRIPLQPMAPVPAAERAVAEPPDPRMTRTVKNLGRHTFNGAPVEGTLETLTFRGPEPVTSTTETWSLVSAKSPMALLRKRVNGASESTTAFLDFSQAEPDASLFRVPDGWSVTDAQPRAQTGVGGPSHTAAGFHYYTMAGGQYPYDVVREAPFSAEQIRETTSNTAIPSGPRQLPVVRLYRDSAGRTRMERELPQAYGDKEPAPVFPEIIDNVDGVFIVLDPAHRIAHRFALGRMEQSPRIHTFSPSMTHGVKESRQDLGENTIEGVAVSGELESWRTPAGVAGNDREYTQSSESWYSTKLKLILLEKTHSITDDTVIRLTHFSQEEPDHSLFEIPAGYTVVDEKGPVGITVIQP